MAVSEQAAADTGVYTDYKGHHRPRVSPLGCLGLAHLLCALPQCTVLRAALLVVRAFGALLDYSKGEGVQVYIDALPVAALGCAVQAGIVLKPSNV